VDFSAFNRQAVQASSAVVARLSLGSLVRTQSLSTMKSGLSGLQKHDRDALKREAKAAFQPIKVDMTHWLCDTYNSWDQPHRHSLVERVLGIENNAELFLSLHSDAGLSITRMNDLTEFLGDLDLAGEVTNVRGNSWRIMAGSRAFLRFSTTAANHQGLSSIAVRVFLLPDSEALLPGRLPPLGAS